VTSEYRGLLLPDNVTATSGLCIGFRHLSRMRSLF
jgi:hypothetical protein